MTSESGSTGFGCLQHPTPWPPPEIPQQQPGPFIRVPLLGSILDAIFAFLAVRVPNDELYVIERQIIGQLQNRPKYNGDWPVDPLTRRIMEILGTAILEEKGNPLDHVTLHPDDPIALLMWGAHDDMTPLAFLVRFEKEFEVSVLDEDRAQLIPCSPKHLDNSRTVREFAEDCVRQLATLGVSSLR